MDALNNYLSQPCSYYLSPISLHYISSNSYNIKSETNFNEWLAVIIYGHFDTKEFSLTIMMELTNLPPLGLALIHNKVIT